MPAGGLGRRNIMAHLWFSLTSPAQTGFSSPTSFFNLSCTLTFAHFFLSWSLSPHFLSHSDILHFSTRQAQKLPIALSFATSSLHLLFPTCISLEMRGPSRPRVPFSPLNHPVPSLSHDALLTAWLDKGEARHLWNQMDRNWCG